MKQFRKAVPGTFYMGATDHNLTTQVAVFIHVVKT